MEKNNKNLNVPNLRFPEFSGEWERCKVKDFTKVVAGATPSTSNKEYWGGDIRWMNSGELNLKRVYEVQGRITQLGYEKTSTKIIPPQSVLIGLAGQGKTRGTAAINYIELCTNQSIASILPSDKYYPEFLYQNIESRYKELRDISSGDGGRGGLNLQMIYNLNIPYCSISEQRKIGDFLCLLDQRIETQRKIIEKYESLIRGIYQFLFQQAKYDHFVSLGDISQISNGNSDVKDASMYNDGSLYPFFDRSDEIKFLPEYLFDKEAIIYPGEGAEFYPRYYNGKFALHQRCYAVYDISTDFIPRYLYHYCKTQNSYFVRNAVGSTVASLRLDTFKRLKIPAIPTHHQESLVMFLDKIEAKIECNRTILKKYEEQKKYLLFTLFI